jgi:hypothetical protein
MGIFHSAKYLRVRKCYKKANKVNVTKRETHTYRKVLNLLRRRKILFNVNEFSENIKINRGIRFLFIGMNAGEPELGHPHLRQPR